MKKYIIIVIIVLLILTGCKDKKEDVKKIDKYIASDINYVQVYTYDEDKLIDSIKIYRGSKVDYLNSSIEKDNIEYSKIIYNDSEYYIKSDNLVSDIKDILKEKEIYSVISHTLLEDIDSSIITGNIKKKDKLEVIGYNSVDELGNIDYYRVKKDNEEGYIDSKYIVYNEEDIDSKYDKNMYKKVYNKVKNYYGGGLAKNLEIIPMEKVSLKDNEMPKSVYALYLNAGVIKNVDKYIKLAKETNINAFVVDIKDNTAPAYPADTFKKLSPTNYKKAINSEKVYKTAIKKLKDNGFYVIGRISVFKDSYYVKDNPKSAILDKKTNKPYKHNSSYWPSPYNRDVWYYTVSLAKESVIKFGFNEINFDYVRFPDRMNSVADKINMNNKYKEDKVAAIERFLRYATDELHKVNAYLSADVFGEATNSYYTTAYGQYFPSISTIVDVISGMPYPDHFSDGYYGIKKPWNHPYELMNAWGKEAVARTKESPTPAVIRTWIQAYDVMSWVDKNGISYNSDEVKSEIQGLFDAGCTGGYITWNAGSSIDKYKQQINAYKIDYLK